MIEIRMPVQPRKATTVILLKALAGKGFQVFLLRRHEKNAFMGGTFVYPGGRLDEGDWDTDLFPSDDRLFQPREWSAARQLSREENLACRVATVRELFEEAGVLLAHRDGRQLRVDKEMRSRLNEYRALINTGQLEFAAMVKKESLQLGLHDLHYFAHWITPEARSIRFDTHFFLARHPGDQEASADRRETTEGVWMTPEESLQGNLKGETPLSPPAIKTLENLSRFDSVDEVFGSLTAEPVQPVLPVLTRCAGQKFLVFPWDPEYETYRSEPQQESPHHGRPSRPTDETTRLLSTPDRYERWVPYCKEP
jgi:8-oxo-dGTP pyrophosphatase MutT (NUDIX family)